MYLLILILVVGTGLINPLLFLVKKIRKVPAIPPTEQSKIKGYVINFVWGFGLVLLFSILCLFAGISFTDIGFRDVVQHHNIWFTAIVLTIYVLFIFFTTCFIFYYLFSPSLRKKESEDHKSEWERAVLPRSRKEKIYWLFSSLATSICDEFIYRGVMFFLLQAIFPDMPIFILLAITSVIFGIKHANQGIKDIASNTYGGALLGAFYLVTGSIIPGMILRFIGGVSRAFPLAAKRSDILPDVLEEKSIEYTEMIEGVEYIKKEIDWNEKTEKITLHGFSIGITVLCLILFHLISSESIISALSNLFNGFRLIHVFFIMGAVVIYFVCVGVHELLHAIFFAPFQKHGFKSTKLGSNQMGFFCETKEPIKVKQYIIGLVAPTIIMGVIPLMIAIATSNIYLLFFAWWMIVGGNGDFMILCGVLKYNKDTWLLVAAREEEIYYYTAK